MTDDNRSNTGNLKDVVREAFNTIMKVRDDRIDLNEMMKDAREMMERAGISKSVFAMAQKYLLMDAQDREAFREFFDMIQEVLDSDFQPSLFDAEKERKKELKKAREAKNAPQQDEGEAEKE